VITKIDAAGDEHPVENINGLLDGLRGLGMPEDHALEN